jgi:hypothetical protein
MKLTGKDIDIICQHNFEYQFMVSLISSDNINSIEDAEKSLDFLNEVENALKTASISESKKTEFIKYIKKGKEILNADIENFKKEK